MYLHLGPKWFQSPTTWLGVPCVLPSIAGVVCGRDWWCPVLTLYLWVAVLNSVLEKYKAQGGQSGMRVLILSCPSAGFDPFAYFVAWDMFSCRKTELCLPNLFPVTINHKHILNTSPYYSRIKTWLGRSKDHILKFKMPYLQGKYFCYQPVLFFIFKKSFLLNRHLRSYWEEKKAIS